MVVRGRWGDEGGGGGFDVMKGGMILMNGGKMMMMGGGLSWTQLQRGGRWSEISLEFVLLDVPYEFLTVWNRYDSKVLSMLLKSALHLHLLYLNIPSFGSVSEASFQSQEHIWING
ncbi:hypothetical protein Tco_0629473 [Tanacetum coccineum]|uniref:Uncharacterized protein n=1 Tax=Tanacetum coccineum TaxID=301880 RepID=A0ABQ4WT67_9ASTR